MNPELDRHKMVWCSHFRELDMYKTDLRKKVFHRVCNKLVTCIRRQVSDSSNLAKCRLEMDMTVSNRKA